MVIIYIPRWSKHEYCIREYKAMEILENRRRALAVGQLPRDKSLIIPIALRGTKTIPEKIKTHYCYTDFSKFTTASCDIKGNHKYANRIDEIAEYIYEIDSLLAGVDLCSDCSNFSMPNLAEAITPLPPPAFPGW